MINDVKHALNSIVGTTTHLKHAHGPGRAFELYVMTGIARALKTRGYQVWIQRSDGSRIRSTDTDRKFVQRGGQPTGIASAADGPNNPSSIVFRRGHRPAWELLNGVTFNGRSTAFHEIDIALVPETVAKTLRNSGGGSPLGRPRVSVECKDVGTTGSIDEMRVFVARLYDLTLLHSHHEYLGIPDPPSTIHPCAAPASKHRPAFTFWQENRQTLNVLARRTGFAQGTAALSRYHAVRPHAGVTVQSPSAAQLMAYVADWINRNDY